MDKRHFQIGLATVLLLVALRLALGCHFLYEGVWKIRHHDEFTAEPFLTQAKGPLSGVFYAMLDDIDGRRRLQKDLTVAAAGKEKRPGDALAAVKDAPLDDRWDGIRKKFLGCYRSEADDLAAKAQNIFKAHAAAMEKYLAEVLPDIQAHFAAVDRFEAAAAGSPDTAFQRERRWKEMQNLRAEAKVWLSELDAREDAYKHALLALIPEEKQKEGCLGEGWNPLFWSRIHQINFAVTYGLTAIGLCLMLGLCTRLAALGGAAFMCFVVSTQPAWPGIYPPDPAVVGHALLVNKDFIEMLALLLVASTQVGRWGGLDYFLHHLVLNPWLSKRCCSRRTKEESK